MSARKLGLRVLRGSRFRVLRFYEVWGLRLRVLRSSGFRVLRGSHNSIRLSSDRFLFFIKAAELQGLDHDGKLLFPTSERSSSRGKRRFDNDEARHDEDGTW